MVTVHVYLKSILPWILNKTYYKLLYVEFIFSTNVSCGSSSSDMGVHPICNVAVVGQLVHADQFVRYLKCLRVFIILV